MLSNTLLCHKMIQIFFLIGLLINGFLLLMMFLSSGNDKFQYWPPPNKRSWQYHSLWWSVRILVICIGVLIYTDNSTIELPFWLRFYLGLPIFFATFILGSIAAVQLGWTNTHGIAENFVASGLYKYTRNPQYVFYSISFIFLGLWVASLEALILLLLLSFWYLRAPIPEEKWLEKQYGEEYLKYKRKVPRYFGNTNNA